MVNRKSVILISCFFAIGLLIVSPALAYDDNTTHRAITYEAIKLFEFYNPNQDFLGLEEDLIIQGSEDEDEAPRWLNHFYDPVHNRGFKGGRSSKDWAQNPNAQASRPGNGVINGYFSDSNDFSWPRAIYEYAWGDKERALLSLGHVLHLVQDATVPDHTRDDAHAFKKTYERYAERFTTNSFELADGLTARGQKPLRLDSLGEYFDILATFSNGNFFSDDTILDDYFGRPKIIKEIKIETPTKFQVFGTGDLDNVKLVYIQKNLDYNGYVKNIYTLNDIDNLVVSDYWQHLSEKAVLGSAGVIELFFKEVAAEKESRRLFDLNKSYLERFLGRLAQGAKNTLAILSFWRTNSDNFDEESEDNNSENSESDESPAPPLAEDEPEIDPEAEIDQAEIDRLMEEVRSLQRQLEDYQTRLAEASKEEDETLDEEEMEEVSEESRRVYTNVSSFSGGGSGSLADDNLNNNEEEVTVARPTILSPADFSAPFSTTTVIFSGTSTPGLTIVCDFGHDNAVMSDSETGEWMLELSNLPQGTTTLNFFARGAEDHFSEPVAIEIAIDSLPPTVSLSVAECADGFMIERCLISKKDEINVSWSVTKGENYSYKLLNTYEFWEDWGEEVEILLAETNSASTTVLTDLPSATPVGWRLVVVAQAEDGTEIQSEPFEIWFSARPLVINEIGWTGTAASSTDEWLELYNSLPFELALDGFWLVGLDDKPLIELSGTIGGQDFYLIERGDDAVVSNLAADLVADFVEDLTAEGLPDNNLQLKLVKKEGEVETIWDQTILFIPGHYWSGGSIERRWSKDGSLQSSWAEINTSWRQNGNDRNGELIIGTPLMENSILRVVPM